MLSAAELADGFKFTTIGLAVGVASGGLTELVANEEVDALQLNKSEHAKNSEEELAAMFAEMIVRGTVAAFGFLLSEKLMRSFNPRRQDSTEGAFFSYAYVTSQVNFYNIVARMGHYVSTGKIFEVGGSTKGACCAGCAGGGPCKGK